MNNDMSQKLTINIDLVLKDIEKLEFYFESEKKCLDEIINYFVNMDGFCKFNSFNKLCDVDLLHSDVDKIISKREEYINSIKSAINRYQVASLDTKEIINGILMNSK